MRPRSDLVLQIASTSDVAKTQAATYTGTLAELDRLSATTVAVRRRASPTAPSWPSCQGSTSTSRCPGTDETRSYSFSNAPDEDRLTFLVKLTPGGAMSDYLAQRAAVGDTISFTGPNGSFFLRETERPVLLLAGGTGLAPILSMLRTLRDHVQPAQGHLIYGVSTDEDVVALDRDRGDRLCANGFHLGPLRVAIQRSSAANKGYVTGLIRPAHLYDGDVAVYLCGPPPMVESVRTHVTDAGIEPTGFYYEKFALAARPPAPATDGARSTSDIRGGRGRRCCRAGDARAIAGQADAAAGDVVGARRLAGSASRRESRSAHRRPADDGAGGDGTAPLGSTPTTARYFPAAQAHLAGQELFAPAATSVAPARAPRSTPWWPTTATRSARSIRRSTRRTRCSRRARRSNSARWS